MSTAEETLDHAVGYWTVCKSLEPRFDGVHTLVGTVHYLFNVFAINRRSP